MRLLTSTMQDEPEAGCAYPVADNRRCGEPRKAASPYCAEHHALCHLRRGSRAEARWLAQFDALARAVGGRRPRPGDAPTRRFLDRLERIVSF